MQQNAELSNLLVLAQSSRDEAIVKSKQNEKAVVELNGEMVKLRSDLETEIKKKDQQLEQ